MGSRTADDQKRYDAFISYARSDALIAQKLQEGLHSFAKPWYRLRVLRVFRDNASLAASPGLWPALRQALDQSRWLVLLASRESAASPWVRREVGYWYESHGADRLLIVLTEDRDAIVGATASAPPANAVARNVDWTDTAVLPPCLHGVFTEEPRFVALGWARSQSHLSVREPLFRSALADLAAPLRGKPKDDLLGEDLRQWRRLRRLGSAAGAALIALAVTASAAAFVAVTQRDSARNQRNVAQARLLLADADSLSRANPRVSLLLDIAAWRGFHLPEARAGLERIAASSHYVATLPVGHNVYGVAFRPDGRLLATGGDDRTVSLWNLDTPTRPVLLTRLSGYSDSVNAVAFSPDGGTLAVASSDETATVWDVTRPATPTRLAVLAAHTGGVNAVAFSPDGTVLATASSDQTTVLWNVTDRVRPRQLAVLGGNTNSVTTVVFAQRGGTVVTGDSDGNTVLWDVRAPARPRRLTRLGGSGLGVNGVNSVAVSPDSRTLVTGAGDGTAAVWDLADVLHPRRLCTVSGQSPVQAVAFHPNGRAVAVARVDGGTEVWSLAQRTAPRLVDTLQSNGSTNWSVAFKPGSDMVVTGTGAGTGADTGAGAVDTGADRDSATVWDLAHGTPKLATEFGDRVRPVVVPVGTGNLVVAGVDNSSDARVYAVDRDSSRATAVGRAAINPAALVASSTQPILAMSDSIEVSIWSLVDPRSPQQISTVTDVAGLKLGPLAASRVGDVLAIGTVNGDVDVVDLRDPSHPTSAARVGTSGAVTALALSPDGGFLVAAGSNAKTSTWILDRRHHPTHGSTLVGLTGTVTAIAIAPDGHTMATESSDAAVEIWDSRQPDRPVQASVLGQDTAGITVLAFGLGGRLLAAGNSTGSVRFWDLTDRKHPSEVAALALGGKVRSLAFSVDGHTLVTGGTAGPPQAWDVQPVSDLLDTDALAAQVCSGAGGPLSHQAWARYAPGVAYQSGCR